VIETLTTGCMIPRSLIVHQQRYHPSDRNSDYWVYDTPGSNSPPAEVFWYIVI
jgi:hypothetical protein